MSFLFPKKKKPDTYKSAAELLQKSDDDFDNQTDFHKQAKSSLSQAEGLYKKITQASKRAQVIECANTYLDAGDKFYHGFKESLEEFWTTAAQNPTPITPSSPSPSQGVPKVDVYEKEKAKKEQHKKVASQQLRSSLFGGEDEEGSSDKPALGKTQSAVLDGQDIESPDEKLIPKIVKKDTGITDGTPYLAQIPGAKPALACFKKAVDLLINYGNETSQAAKASIEFGKLCGELRLYDAMYESFSRAIDFYESAESYTSANVAFMDCAQHMAFPCKQFDKAIKFYQKMIYADWNQRSKIGTGEKFMMTSHRNTVVFQMFVCKIMTTITPIGQLSGVKQVLEEMRTGSGMEFGNNFEASPEFKLLAGILQAFLEIKKEERTKKFANAYKSYSQSNTVTDWIKKMLLAVKDHLNYCFSSQDGLE